jgi:hypothetical protein
MGVRPKDKKPLEGKSVAKTNLELTDIVAEIAKIVAASTGLGTQPTTVQPEVPDRVQAPPVLPIQAPPRRVQDLEAEYEETKKKLSELHKQIELSSSQSSSTGAEANIPASFGEGPGEPKTTAKRSGSKR